MSKRFAIGFDEEAQEFTVALLDPMIAHLPPMTSFKSFADAQAYTAIKASEHGYLEFEYYTQAEVDEQEREKQEAWAKQMLTVIGTGNEELQ